MSHSAQFPHRGRIDYLSGTLEVDLSPEDLYTHGAVKTAITARLFALIEEEGRGSVFMDRTRIVSPEVDLGRLPALYAAAGVPELWIVDARGDEMSFLIQVLSPEGYVTQEADSESWCTSPLLGRLCRVSRPKTEVSRWTYRLETRA